MAKTQKTGRLAKADLQKRKSGTAKPPPPRARDRRSPLQLAGRRTFDARERQLPTRDRDELPEEPLVEAPDGTTEAQVKAEMQELGPIFLPSPQDAHRVLGELAALYHERFDTQRKFDDLKVQLRKVSADLEKLSTRIAERIRVSTHKTGLPLFADVEGAGS